MSDNLAKVLIVCASLLIVTLCINSVCFICSMTFLFSKDILLALTTPTLAIMTIPSIEVTAPIQPTNTAEIIQPENTALPTDTPALITPLPTATSTLPAPTNTVAPTNSPIPTTTSAPIPFTNIPAATNIVAPTNTPLPTATYTQPPIMNIPAPSNTPLPTANLTLPPQPLVFSGSGATVLDINKWQGPAIAHMTYTRQSNFIVESFDADNNQIELLANTIGDYNGTVPADFENTDTKRISITAGGAWGLQILPVSSAQIVSVPGNVGGTGDVVIILEGAIPDKITADASQASHNFVITAYNYKPSMDYLDLLVNEIAPYTGAFLAPKGTTFLVIKATGPWKLEITGR